MQEVLKYLKEAPTFYLATVDGEGARVRPFGAVMEWDGKLYIMTSNQKDVYRQIQKNPRVELCASGAGGSWLRVAATLVADDSREAKVQMLEEYPSLTGMYSPDDGKMALLYLKDATATFSSFTAEPRTVTF